MNPDLSNDIIDIIMKMRTEEMRKDKEIKDNKKNFKKVMEQIEGQFYYELSGKFYFNFSLSGPLAIFLFQKRYI